MGRRRRDLVDGGLERGGVMRGRGTETADLPHVLQRGGTHVGVGYLFGVGRAQRLDASAHTRSVRLPEARTAAEAYGCRDASVYKSPHPVLVLPEEEARQNGYIRHYCRSVRGPAARGLFAPVAGRACPALTALDVTPATFGPVFDVTPPTFDPGVDVTPTTFDWRWM